MGGKKKKSAPQVAPAEAGSCGSSAAGTGEVENLKKHAASSKASRPAKGSKSKGGVADLLQFIKDSCIACVTSV